MELAGGRSEAAWSLFIDQYRRLIFFALRRYARDQDDVMDVFAHVCESLRADDFARLRRYAAAPSPNARFTSWLVAVVRNLAVDWLRQREGRRRHPVPAGLSPLQQRIFQCVFVEGISHEGCFQLLTASTGSALSAHQFAEALNGTYRIVDAAGGSGSTRSRAAPPAPEEPSAYEALLADDAAAHLGNLLDILNPADRLAVQLFVVHELAAADVARVVGWPNAKMVYNRVTRALAALRAELARRGLGRDDL